MQRMFVGVVGLAIAGVGAWQGDDLAAAVVALDDRVAAIEERLEARPLASAEADGALRFDGEGDAVSEPFPLAQGTALFTIETGDGFASIDLLAAPGTGRTNYRNLDMGQGPTTGTVAVPLFEAGEYVVAVKGEPVWSVMIEQ